MTLANRLRLAASLGRGGQKIPESSAPSTKRTSATAVGSSVDGYVTVEFDDGTQMEVPTIASVEPGDEVQLLLDGADIIALGSGGWGDRMNDATMGAQTAGDEAAAVAEATNQHFWTRSINPDGAGAGAFVTDEEQEDFIEEAADGFPDYDASTRPFHNLLMNSLGILIREKLNNLVSITKSAITFWDGNGNATGNEVAKFEKSGIEFKTKSSSQTYGTFTIIPDGLINAVGYKNGFAYSMTVGTTGIELADNEYSIFCADYYTFGYDNYKPVLYTGDDNDGSLFYRYSGDDIGLPIFKIIEFPHTSANITRGNGASFNGNNALSITGVPSGYSPIAVVGVSSNHGQNWYVGQFNISSVANKKLSVSYKNAFGSTSGETCTFTFYILCVPSVNYS